jgi:predicted PurR-regulated permease PerM
VLDAMTHLHLDLLQGESADLLRTSVAAEGVTLTRLLVGDVLLFSAEAAATAVLLYFLLAAQPALTARVLAVLPSRRSRVRLLSSLRRAEQDVGRFVVTMTLANLGLAAASAGALVVIGLPHALSWGVAIAVLAFIPYVGPLLITVLLLLAGSVAFGTTGQALVPPIVFLVLHGIEANLISPWWMGYRLRLSRLAVVVAVLVFGWTWGVAGSVIAVPLLLVVRTTCRREGRMAFVSACLEADEAPVARISALLRRTSRV